MIKNWNSFNESFFDRFRRNKKEDKPTSDTYKGEDDDLMNRILLRIEKEDNLEKVTFEKKPNLISYIKYELDDNDYIEVGLAAYTSIKLINDEDTYILDLSNKIRNKTSYVFKTLYSKLDKKIRSGKRSKFSDKY